MRLIDADALLDKLNEESIEYRADINNAIVHAPTVDAVPVVRCEVCKNGFKIGNDLLCSHLSGLCGLNVVVNNNEFCSYGERSKHEID